MSRNHGENLILLTGIPFFLGCIRTHSNAYSFATGWALWEKQETMYSLKEKV